MDPRAPGRERGLPPGPGAASGGLDLDLPSNGLSRLGNVHLEDPVLERGLDLAGVATLRQRHRPGERPGPSLAAVVVVLARLLLSASFTADGQHPVLDADIDVVSFEAGKISPEHDLVLAVEHVDRRRPAAHLTTHAG